MLHTMHNCRRLHFSFIADTVRFKNVCFALLLLALRKQAALFSAILSRSIYLCLSATSTRVVKLPAAAD